MVLDSARSVRPMAGRAVCGVVVDHRHRRFCAGGSWRRDLSDVPMGVSLAWTRHSRTVGPSDGARGNRAVSVCSQSYVRRRATRSTRRGDVLRIMDLPLVRAQLVRVDSSQRDLVRGALPYTPVRRFVQAIPILSPSMDPWIAVSTSCLTRQ